MKDMLYMLMNPIRPFVTTLLSSMATCPSPPLSLFLSFTLLAGTYRETQQIHSWYVFNMPMGHWLCAKMTNNHMRIVYIHYYFYSVILRLCGAWARARVRLYMQIFCVQFYHI